MRSNSSKKLAVLTWIHKGGYVGGSAEAYDGTARSAVGDMIIVTVNYRLGQLGFLITVDSRATGNQGFGINLSL